jgi:hypothetical protein
MKTIMMILAVTGFGFAQDSCAGAPGAIKLFHVTGRHQCQSKQNIGYWMSVELRDATDCGAGHSRLRQQNPCTNYNGQQQENGRSIQYSAGSCSPIF